MADSLIQDNDISPPKGNILVLIINCETRACDNNIEQLKLAFSDEYFIVHEYKTKSLHEHQYMYKALQYASYGPWVKDENGKNKPQKHWSDMPCLIIKDSSIITISNLVEYLEKAFKTPADLFFLCTWNDVCDKYITINETSDACLKWHSHSCATQAICYRPSARDHIRRALQHSSKLPLELPFILNREIKVGHLKGAVFIPNLVHYDINVATSHLDYIKINACAPSLSKKHNTNISIFIWFVALSIIILLVSWCLMDMTPGLLTLS